MNVPLSWIYSFVFWKNWRYQKDISKLTDLYSKGATAGKAPKAWALPRFWVSIHSYKKQPVKKIWGRMLGLALLKFNVAPLYLNWIFDMIFKAKSKIKIF